MNLFLIAISESQIANFNGISLNNGFTYISKIPNRLKNKWAKAATRAVTLRVSAANIAVMVVPILAPSVNGYTCLSVRTPAPARGTIVEVVIDELWTIIVKSIPNTMPWAAVLKINLSKNCCTLSSTKLRRSLTIEYSIANVSKTLRITNTVLLKLRLSI